MLIAMFLSAIVLYIVGSAMDRSERARQDREWEEVLRKRRARREQQ